MRMLYLTFDGQWYVLPSSSPLEPTLTWLQLCDLFLVLIADSVYDARSRTFLELVAKALGFEWTDIVRFENRVTEALEISEAVEKTEQGEIIEGRRTQARRRRYAMMGLAAAGSSRFHPHLHGPQCLYSRAKF